jgi:prepilin-type N-terminal cleavage/methylation domain-containing protein/prepilin-type processing-associated H-X9-DG protein
MADRVFLENLVGTASARCHSTMKNPLSRLRTGAFTLVEMLTVIAIIGILAALLLPVLAQAKARAMRVQCVSNLRQTGLAFHMFANDHGGKFPTFVSTNDGGSLEYVAAGNQANGPFYFSYKYFRPLAGTLVMPKLLACPADLERWPATNFSQFNNSNLSYDIGLIANPNNSSAILVADRNFPGQPDPAYHSPDIRLIPGPVGLRHWGPDLHEQKGNILFADSHVEESYDAIITSETTVSEDVAYPDVKTSAGFPSAGGGGGGGGGGAGGGGAGTPNNAPIQPATPIGNMPQAVSASQVFSNNASVANISNPAPGNSTGTNQPGSPAAVAFNGQSGAKKSFAASPMTIQATDAAQTNNVTPVQTATNAVAATDDDSDMSYFDRRLVKFCQYLFGLGYLLLLLIFLVWLYFKVRREWRRWQARRQKP